MLISAETGRVKPIGFERACFVAGDNAAPRRSGLGRLGVDHDMYDEFGGEDRDSGRVSAWMAFARACVHEVVALVELHWSAEVSGYGSTVTAMIELCVVAFAIRSSVSYFREMR